MYLTAQQKLQGRRNFWRVAGRGVDPRRLKLETCVTRHIAGGPVSAGVVGTGGQGRGSLLDNCLKEFINIEAVCDINPAHRALAVQGLVAAGYKAPREYEDWEEMARREDLELVLVATPLWTHAGITIGFLESGANVFCEKMMAYDVASCRHMIEAARRHRCLLEIGYPRFYEPLYQAVYRNIIQPKLLGDIQYVRLHTHRNSSWRREEKPPSGDYNPSRWGYPNWETLSNWRMYNRYSRGLVSELGSHQTSLAEWFLGSTARSVYGTGGIYHYKDGREVDDHIFLTFQHPGGCTVELSVILTNSFGGLYEEFLGSKGTLILSETDGGMFFPKEEACFAGEPLQDRDETLPWTTAWDIAFRTELYGICSAIRLGTPLLCGAERAMNSASVALAGKLAIAKREPVEIATG
jgi:predicted dehydrogenase